MFNIPRFTVTQNLITQRVCNTHTITTIKHFFAIQIFHFFTLYTFQFRFHFIQVQNRFHKFGRQIFFAVTNHSPDSYLFPRVKLWKHFVIYFGNRHTDFLCTNQSTVILGNVFFDETFTYRYRVFVFWFRKNVCNLYIEHATEFASHKLKLFHRLYRNENTCAHREFFRHHNIGVTACKIVTIYVFNYLIRVFCVGVRETTRKRPLQHRKLIQTCNIQRMNFINIFKVRNRLTCFVSCFKAYRTTILAHKPRFCNR